VVTSFKRPPVKVPLSASLVRDLAFDQWPKSPVEWTGDGRLVTEPTPAHVRDWVIRDANTPGFGVRVTRGSKSYFVQRKRRGSTSDRWVLTDQHSFKAAKAQAQQWYAAMGRVEDPRQVLAEKARAVTEMRQRARWTFGAVFAGYIADGEARVMGHLLKASTVTDRKKVPGWLGDTDLWRTPLDQVTEAVVAQTFVPLFASATATRSAQRMGEPKKRGKGPAGDVATAHKCVTYCMGGWNWATGAKVTANPFAQWRNQNRRKLPKVERRQTVLPTTQAEGVAWLKGLLALRDAEDHALAVTADYVLMAVLWGGRKTETALLRWMDVDMPGLAVCFAAETTKAQRDHYIPLAPWAVSLLQARRERTMAAGHPAGPRDLVFLNPATETGAISDYRPVIKPLHTQTGLWVRLHDLRRTMAGEVFGSSGNLGTVAFALGHASAETDVTAGYVQRQAALDTLRDLYDLRERRLRQLVGLDQPAETVMTETQRSILQAARMMLEQAGLNVAALTVEPHRPFA